MEHIARQLTREDFAAFDRILVMDRQNLKQALSLSEEAHHPKITMMRAFDPMGEGDVPDPYYGSEQDFQEVFEILDRSVEALIQDLVKKT